MSDRSADPSASAAAGRAGLAPRDLPRFRPRLDFELRRRPPVGTPHAGRRKALDDAGGVQRPARALPVPAGAEHRQSLRGLGIAGARRCRACWPACSACSGLSCPDDCRRHVVSRLRRVDADARRAHRARRRRGGADHEHGGARWRGRCCAALGSGAARGVGRLLAIGLLRSISAVLLVLVLLSIALAWRRLPGESPKRAPNERPMSDILARCARAICDAVAVRHRRRQHRGAGDAAPDGRDPGWLSDRQFSELYAIAQATPGPERDVRCAAGTFYRGRRRGDRDDRWPCAGRPAFSPIACRRC